MPSHICTKALKRRARFRYIDVVEEYRASLARSARILQLIRRIAEHHAARDGKSRVLPRSAARSLTRES